MAYIHHNGILPSHLKRMKSYGRPRGYYAKWNKSDRERQIFYDSTYMGNLENKAERLIDTENKVVVARDGVWELDK